VANKFGFANCQTVAPPAIGDTQQGKAAASGGTAAAQSRAFRRKSAKAAAAASKIMPLKPPPAMRPCSILELDATRCHWPLGGFHNVAAQFCGGTPAPGHRYCPHHLRTVHGHGSVS
jgi:hypothetical protein